MFKFNCPSCRGEIEAEDEMAGQLADCPYCGTTVEVKRPTARLRKAAPSVQTQQSNLASQVPPIGRLVKDGCFWLGFLLYLIGVLFAWLIKGRDGAIMAMYGLAFNILVLIVFYVVGVIIASNI